jgi:hypothetical protein
MVCFFLLPNINQSSNHGLVVLRLEDVIEADSAAENVPCGSGLVNYTVGIP